MLPKNCDSAADKAHRGEKTWQTGSVDAADRQHTACFNQQLKSSKDSASVAWQKEASLVLYVRAAEPAASKQVIKNVNSFKVK